MRKTKHYIVVAIILFSCLNVSNVLFSTNSSPLKEEDEESIHIGDTITIYKTPYLNDHSIIYNSVEKKWHLYGIASNQTSFIHLTADSLTQEGWVKVGLYTDGGAQIWAPHIIYHDSLYHMFYTKIAIPREIHHVVSSDLYSWSKSTGPVLASANEYNKNLKNKDPMVFRNEEKKQWVMYCSMMKDDIHWVVGYSTSSDLYNWSEPQICFDENTDSPGVESPFVVKYGDYYYLFLSARPWPRGGEEIFRSLSPYAWNAKDIVKRIDPWHAAEVVRDLNGDWYLSLSVAFEKDLKIAPFFWD